ncbi:MAG: hypothetical protein Q9187_003346 [Circinaria calcarea]
MSKEEYEKSVRELFALKREGISFNNLADETYEEIIKNLYTRLGILQERGDYGELLDKLLKAAISADILGRPHVFYRENDIELVEQGFAIVYSWINNLESKLNECFIFKGRTEGQLTARFKKDQSVEDGVVNLLVEVEKAQCLFINCPINKLTGEMLHDGFIIIDYSIAKLATKLEENGLTIIDRSRTHLTAKPSEATAMTSEQIEKQIDDLAEWITRKKDSFTVERYIKDKLTADMVKQGFTV